MTLAVMAVATQAVKHVVLIVADGALISHVAEPIQTLDIRIWATQAVKSTLQTLIDWLQMV